MIHKKNVMHLILTFAILMIGVVAHAQSVGKFKGRIIEQATKQPIIGATVRLENTQFGTNTDTTGAFIITNIPAGAYAVTISYIGFQTKNISEILINPGKTYDAEIELLEEATNMDEVTVLAFKGEENPLTPVSTFSYSREEIFRNPGAQGDIMRALSVLPGVVSSGAQFSAIAARGQGTHDNVYMVDDIPMFNLSHLETEGFNSGFNDPNGGRFSIFAPRVIDNVQFQNGGFDALYGRRSSSYLGLGIKEGNSDTWSFSGQFDLLGATLLADGPISKKTSIFTSARYQDFATSITITDQKNAGTITFGDYIVKTTTNINAKNKLSFMLVYNQESPSRKIDDISSDVDINEDNGAATSLFTSETSKLAAGLNLRTLLDKTSYLKNILYYRESKVDNKFGRFTPSLDAEGMIVDPKYGPHEGDLRHIVNNQQEFGYRSIYTKQFGSVSLSAGFDLAMLNLEFERSLKRTDTVFTFRTTDVRPSPSQYYQIITPGQFNSAFDDNAFNGSTYVSLSWNITDRFTLNPGVRYDYSGFSEQSTVSPRLSGSLLLNDRESLNFSTGLYYQDVAYTDVAASQDLKSARTFQSVLGYKMQFSPDLKLVVEGWYKEFDDLVVQPNRFQSAFTNDGTGQAYGGDISLVKRLSKKYYGSISYSYMDSKRDDHNGQGEYDYTFSIPHTVNALVSYKPNNKWIFSGKLRYSTGRPTDSYIVYENVLNDPNKMKYAQEVTEVNGDRLPDYIALDVRVDYNVQWGKRAMFTTFLDLANVTGRFNQNSEIFVPDTGKVYLLGLGMFPSFGVRVEL